MADDPAGLDNNVQLYFTNSKAPHETASASNTFADKVTTLSTCGADGEALNVLITGAFVPQPLVVVVVAKPPMVSIKSAIVPLLNCAFKR